MARHAGLIVVLAFVGSLVQATEPPDDPAKKLTTTLAVQRALVVGRDLLNNGQALKAVSTLEEQLPHINGNAQYLACLRDAYLACLRDPAILADADQTKLYRQRLRILEPQPTSSAPPTEAVAQRETLAPPPPVPEPVVTIVPPPPAAPLDLSDATAAFIKKDYARAEQLFAAAQKQSREPLPEMARRQWAFCHLDAATKLVNSKQPDRAEVERRVQVALALAPDLQAVSQPILDKNRETTAEASAAQIVETANFRVTHPTSRAAAEQAGAAAEAARKAICVKWAGADLPAWSAKCELVLHATAAEYGHATEQSQVAPGHSTLRRNGPTVVSRRVDLRCDVVEWLTATLPHELTHVVVADLCPEPLPRWADEAIAVLSEPAERVARYRRTLSRCQTDHSLFPVGELLQSTHYPASERITAFYTQSVSVAEFLIERNGPKAFIAFLQQAPRYGFDKALERHYQIRGYAELNERWQSWALGPTVAR